MIEKNKNLKTLNTFMIPIVAKYFANINSVHTLKKICISDEWKESQKKLILGGGSNILFVNDYDGFVLKNKIKGIEIIEEDEDEILVKVGAGENWHQFVMWSVKKGFWGIENLVYIPGTVGAAPVQNIGAYGVEVSSNINAVEYIHFSNLEKKKIPYSNCDFSYRNSFFKKNIGKNFITYVYFKLQKKRKAILNYGRIKEALIEKNIKEPSSEDIANIIINIRKSKLPELGELGMAGSFFKNPIIPNKQLKELQKKFPEIKYFELENDLVKIPAGWILENLGYKGFIDGHVGNYKKHALVVVHYGNGTGEEVYLHIKNIMKKVKEVFDIVLEPEVVII